MSGFGRHFSHQRRLFMAGAALVAAVSLSAPSRVQAGTADAAPTDPANLKTRTLGFAVTSLPYALAKNADDCPDGMAMAPKALYLQSVSSAERERLTKPENLKEFEQLAYHTADGKDFCEVPDFPRPQQRTPKGHVSYGMNLDGTTDGAATANSCAHEKFTGPNGEPAVDNQTYRVIGCSSNWRGFPGEEGYLESLRNAAFKDGGTTILMEIMGVKDGRNDDNVTVGIYNGTSPMALDPNGHMLPYASLTMTADKKFQAVAKGRIVDGVVTIEPTDLKLHFDIGGYQRQYDFRSARIRLELKPDGSAKGLLAGYLDLYDVDTTKGARSEGTEMVGFDCPSFSQAARRFADGFKDAKTGQCTALSTAFEINAIPAFVIHPEDAKKTASAAPAAH